MQPLAHEGWKHKDLKEPQTVASRAVWQFQLGVFFCQQLAGVCVCQEQQLTPFKRKDGIYIALTFNM